MRKIKEFIKESYGEFRKVVWPSRDSVAASARVVIISTIVFALFFGLVDFVLSRALLGLFSIF